MKENDFAEWLLGTKQWYETNRNLVLYGGIAVLVVVVGVVATLVMRQNSASTASRMLAEAMVVAEAPVMPPTAETGKPPMQPPGTYATDKARFEAALPRLLSVADAYPTLEPGVMARYRAAAALVAIGRTAEGIERYREVIANSKGVYQVMAKLGIADAQLVAGQFEPALASLNELAKDTASDIPVDGVLMQLARGYRLAGKSDEAIKTFRRVADEFPQSPYAPIARREIDNEELAPVAAR